MMMMMWRVLFATTLVGGVAWLAGGLDPDTLGEVDAGGLVGAAILIGLYLIPTIVAGHRKHHNRDAIALLNVLLGWTVIGWIVAAVWALTVPMPRDEVMP
jgi:hypothetical protein